MKFTPKQIRDIDFKGNKDKLKRIKKVRGTVRKCQ
jgi:hypothetical protein